MWKWILKAVLAVSDNPEVQQWAKRKAWAVAGKILSRADEKARDVAAVADIEPPQQVG